MTVLRNSELGLNIRSRSDLEDSLTLQKPLMQKQRRSQLGFHLRKATEAVQTLSAISVRYDRGLPRATTVEMVRRHQLRCMLFFFLIKATVAIEDLLVVLAVGDQRTDSSVILFLDLKNDVYVYASEDEYVQVPAEASRGRWIPPELELELVISLQTGMLGIKLWSSVRAMYILKYQVISPVPKTHCQIPVSFRSYDSLDFPPSLDNGELSRVQE